MRDSDAKQAERRSRGFERASGLLGERIRKVGEKRGFSVSRVLTHWAEIVGADLAAMAQPVKVTYGREGFGATLTLLTTGAMAPLVQMRLPDIRDRVNACYGYSAISHVRVTQTAPGGFAEGQAAFAHAPRQAQPAALSPEASARAAEAAQGVEDPGLRSALELLARNVLSKDRTETDTRQK